MARSLRARLPAPIFADAALTVPMPLHSERCPARLDARGVPGDRLCRCQSGRWTLEVGSLGAELLLDGDAALVRFDGHSPCWVERGAVVRELRRETPKVPAPRGPQLPPDLVLLRERLDDGLCRYPRRRLRPAGGDLVFVRSDARSGTWRPRRFLCTTRTSKGRVAVLIDPALLRTQTGTLGWHQGDYLPLHGEPWQSLLVAYPLPDGTEDPGWSVA